MRLVKLKALPQRCIYAVTIILLLIVMSKIMMKVKFLQTPFTGKIGSFQFHPGNTNQKVYSFKNKWQESDICKPYSNIDADDEFYVGRLSSKAGQISIFIHNPSDDIISKTIESTNGYEINLINRVLDELHKDTDVHVIDIGTNIGQLCLATALYGRRCIGIDAVKSNIQHACATSERLALHSKITLIHNLLSDKEEDVNYVMNGKGDFSSVYVDRDNIFPLKRNSTAFKFPLSVEPQNMRGKHIYKKIVSKAVKLDSILELNDMKHFQKVFIRLDVEGYEHRVLLGAKEFMLEKDVQGILMQWKWHRGRKSAATIKTFLYNLGFAAYDVNNNELEVQKSDVWPHDVIWYPYITQTGLLD